MRRPASPAPTSPAVALWMALAVVGSSVPAGARCAPDAVAVGPTCIDEYEESVWSVPAKNTKLVATIRRGAATEAQLMAGGAQQLGAIPMGDCNAEAYGADFPKTGNWTTPLYAVSVAGVPPSTCITWFQAEQACRLSGKRLATNEEWQAAAAGTPDPGNDDDGSTTCVTNSPFASLTGARGGCVSKWGAHDMAGNVWEWVAGWVPPGTSCGNWDADHGGDLTCFAIIPFQPPSVPQEIVSFDANLPGAVIRGGNFATGARNGIFAIYSAVNPTNVSRSTGFRCAR